MKNQRVDYDRLCQAIYRARLTLRRWREERREMVRQLVGSHWSDEGSREKVPVNLISLYVQIVGRSLIAKNPRVLLSTFERKNKSAVSAMQEWMNREIQKMHLEMTLQRVVLDALFSVGIAKVALATPADAAMVGWNQPAGKPFCERVDLDDFVFDIHARELREAGYIGHRFRIPLEVLHDSKIYDTSRLKVQASEDRWFNIEGDERIGTLGRGFLSGADEEFEPFVDLWEIYLPRKRLVITLADDDMTGVSGNVANDYKPLRVQEWLGPDEGPYHFLSYQTVPGNAMPKAPVQDLFDLHDLTNRLYRKLGRQAERQKEVVAVAAGAMEDGSRIQEASDGEIIRVDRPEAIIPLVFNGPNAGNFQYAIHLWELFSKHAGNLEMMGGLSPQSKTATQDKMLMASASGQVAFMQNDTIGFVSDVLKSLGWYWWHDPFRTMQVDSKIPGLPEMSVNRKVTPQRRQQQKFDDLDIFVDPYSLQHQTPQAKGQMLTQIVQQTIAPFMGILQQQGVAFDMNAFLTKLAHYYDMPDLMEIMTVMEPPQPKSQEGGSEQPGMPAETTRNYNRRSLGGDSEQARSAALKTELAGMSQAQSNGPVTQANGQQR